jgi:hypothetical protein
MTTTPSNAVPTSPRRHGHIALAAVVAFGILAAGCGDDNSATNDVPPTGTTTGYSWDHDSHHD